MLQLSVTKSQKIQKTLLNPVLSSLQNPSSKQTDNLPTHTSTYSSFFRAKQKRYNKHHVFLEIQHVLVFITNFKIKSKKSLHIYSDGQVKLWYHTQSVSISTYKLSSRNLCTNYSFQKNGRLETENASDSHL